jgi:nucleotide-binding universal stress UspA family protein
MFRRILVTLDGSDFGEAALPAAVGLARKSGAHLRLVSVHDSGWASLRGTWSDAAHGEATRYLERTRALLAPMHPDVTASVREGYVPDEILNEARDFSADLIVMATHGRGTLSRFWLGSVADHCVRRAHRPLLLVRPRDHGSSSRQGSLAVRRVVVPLDGSELSERALIYALQLADLFSSPLALVRVVQEHAMLETEMIPDSHQTNVQMLEEAQVAAAAYLEGITARVAEWGFDPTTVVAVDDHVARAVLSHAGRDLIVMATHARSGLDRAFLGSVTDTVVRSAAGPVLVIPPEIAFPERAATAAEGVRTAIPLPV